MSDLTDTQRAQVTIDIRFYLGHEQFVRHSTVIFEEIFYDIRRCPSLPLALPVLFVSSPAVAIFLPLCLLVVLLPRAIDTCHRPSRQQTLTAYSRPCHPLI